MKIDWQLLLTVVVALLVYEEKKKLFLNSVLEKIGNFEDLDEA